MRFSWRPRCDYTVTDRKRAAAVRLHKRQRETIPLLAPLIAERWPSIDGVMTQRAATWIAVEQKDRDRRAQRWRDARRDIDSRPPALRWALLTYWNEHRWLPGDPSYLLILLHRFDNGRMVLRDGEIEPARIVIAVSEAVAAFGPSKPMSGGWFGTRTVKRRTALTSNPHANAERRQGRGQL